MCTLSELRPVEQCVDTAPLVNNYGGAQRKMAHNDTRQHERGCIPIAMYAMTRERATHCKALANINNTCVLRHKVCTHGKPGVHWINVCETALDNTTITTQ